MNEVKWIKLATDIFNDEKMLVIESLPDADAIIVIWFKLLTLCGRVNTQGVLMINDKIPYTEEMLSAVFRRKLSQVKLALETFEALEMIEIINNVITISNWNKHQDLEKIASRREYMREYMMEYREKQKQLALSDNESKHLRKHLHKPLRKHDVNRADNNISYSSSLSNNISNKDKDINISSKDKHKDIKRTVFKIPTLDEVEAYIIEKDYNVDAEQFIDFYESKGWMIGKNKMKSWKAAVRTWQRNSKDNKSTNNKKIDALAKFAIGE